MRAKRPTGSRGNSALQAKLSEPADTIEGLEAELTRELPDYENAMGQYQGLLEASTKQFANMLAQANEELKASVGEAKARMEQQLLDAKEQVEKDTTPRQVPETAWVNNHLVLNKAAVDLIDSMFDQFRDVLQNLSDQ